MMRAFHSICPKLAADECRWIVGGFGQSELGSSRFALREFYCVDLACECRRCIIQATSEFGEIEATIGYAFDADAVLRGPYLDPLLPQSPSAGHWLKYLTDYFEGDQDYPRRLEQHYRLARQVANGQLREEDCPRWNLPDQSTYRERRKDHWRIDATPPSPEELKAIRSVPRPQALASLVEEFARQNNINLDEEGGAEIAAAMLAERLSNRGRREKTPLGNEDLAYNRKERRRMKKSSRRR